MNKEFFLGLETGFPSLTESLEWTHDYDGGEAPSELKPVVEIYDAETETWQRVA